jgi:hypothetical protein
MSKLLQGALSISNPSTGGVNIRVEDELSGAQFLDLTISHEEFSRALGHLSSRPCEFEVRGLAYIGKQRVTEQRTAIAPDLGYDRQKYAAWLTENAQEEGWMLNTYLGSQSSIAAQKDGTQLLHYSVTKYVEVA